MAKATVDIDLDQRAVAQLAISTSTEVARNGAKSLQRKARTNAPKRTGALAASIEIRIVGSPGLETAFEVGSPLKYAPYQEFGTGPIIAKPGKVMVWQSGGVTVFARRTSGVPATHFMRNSLHSLTESDFK